MKDQQYRIEDLIEDPSFVSWVQQTDPEAIRYWDQWKLEHPDQEELMEAATAIVKGLSFAPTYPSKEKIAEGLARLNEAIDVGESNDVKVVRIQRLWNQRYRMVAGIAILFLLGLFGFQWLQPNSIEYKTDYGEQLAIDLPDGTHLNLNANSQLRYLKDQPRKIWLEGEAFFTVARQNEGTVKFEVITSDLTVEVYGTEFNVNSRKQQTQVILEEGEIKLALKNGEKKELKPGDLLTFSASKNRIIEETRVERFEPLTSWKNGTLIFEDISLREAMDRVSELYGVEVTFEQSHMAEERIYLAVPIDNIDICLEALERSGSLQIKREEAVLTVSRSPN